MSHNLFVTPAAIAGVGWLRDQRSREGTLFRADGVVGSEPIRVFAGLTTPSAPKRWRRSILLMSRPPLLCEEGNIGRSNVRVYQANAAWRNEDRRCL